MSYQGQYYNQGYRVGSGSSAAQARPFDRLPNGQPDQFLVIPGDDAQVLVQCGATLILKRRVWVPRVKELKLYLEEVKPKITDWSAKVALETVEACACNCGGAKDQCRKTGYNRVGGPAYQQGYAKSYGPQDCGPKGNCGPKAYPYGYPKY